MKILCYLAALLLFEFSDAKPLKSEKLSDFLQRIDSDKSNAAKSQDPILNVEGINIRQSAKNSLLAKEKALEGAMRCAFNRIARSTFFCNPPEDILGQEISDCVMDYSIENEKFSAVFYSAKVSFSFYRKNVAKLLKKYGQRISQDEFLSDTAVDLELIIYLKDYIENFPNLNSLNPRVVQFYNDTIIIVINNNDFSNFLNLNIRYASSFSSNKTPC